MKSYDELEKELIEDEEAEERAFNEIAMLKGECRYWYRGGRKCASLKNGVCSEDDLPCSYRGKKTGGNCRMGFKGENCGIEWRGICGSNGRRCSRYE